MRKVSVYLFYCILSVCVNTAFALNCPEYPSNAYYWGTGTTYIVYRGGQGYWWYSKQTGQPESSMIFGTPDSVILNRLKNGGGVGSLSRCDPLWGKDTDGDGCPDVAELICGAGVNSPDKNPYDDFMDDVDRCGNGDQGACDRMRGSPLWDIDSDDDGHSDADELLGDKDPNNPDSYPGDDAGDDGPGPTDPTDPTDPVDPSNPGGDGGGGDDGGGSDGGGGGDGEGGTDGGGDGGGEDNKDDEEFPDYEEWYQDLVDKGVISDDGLFEGTWGNTWGRLFYWMEKDAFDRIKVLKQQQKEIDVVESINARLVTISQDEYRELFGEEALLDELRSIRHGILGENETEEKSFDKLLQIYEKLSDLMPNYNDDTPNSELLLALNEMQRVLNNRILENISVEEEQLGKTANMIGKIESLATLIRQGNEGHANRDSTRDAILNQIRDKISSLSSTFDLSTVESRLVQIVSKMDNQPDVKVTVTVPENAIDVDIDLASVLAELRDISSKIDNGEDVDLSDVEKMLAGILEKVTQGEKVDLSGIESRLDTIAEKIDKDDATISVEVDLSKVESQLSGINDKLDKLLKGDDDEGGGDDGDKDEPPGWGGFDEWGKPELTDDMKFELDTSKHKDELASAFEKTGINFSELSDYSASAFSREVRIPVGGSLGNLRWYSYHFSMTQFPAEVNSTLLELFAYMKVLAKAIMVFIFLRCIWSLLWSL